MPSFNIYDFDTIDNLVEKHIFREIGTNDWSLLIGHTLGVDHIGHVYTPHSIQMEDKLAQMTKLIKNIAEYLDNDTMLLAFGDHGMTDSGSHGGGSNLEVDSGLLTVFGGNWSTFKQMEGDDNMQIDLTPTLAILLGIPIPHNSLGILMSHMIPFKNCSEVEGVLGHAIFENAFQLLRVKYEKDKDVVKLWLKYLDCMSKDECRANSSYIVSLYNSTYTWMSARVGKLKSKDSFVNTNILLVGMVVQICYILMLVSDSTDLGDSMLLVLFGITALLLQSIIVILLVTPYYITRLISYIYAAKRKLSNIIEVIISNKAIVIPSTIVVIAEVFCIFGFNAMKYEDIIVLIATAYLIFTIAPKYLLLCPLLILHIPSIQITLNLSAEATLSITSIIAYKLYTITQARSPRNRLKSPAITTAMAITDITAILFIIEKHLFSTNHLFILYAICLIYSLFFVIFYFQKYPYLSLIQAGNILIYTSKLYSSLPMLVLSILTEIIAFAHISWNPLTIYTLSQLVFFATGHMKKISVLQVECAYHVFKRFIAILHGSLVCINILGPSLLICTIWKHCISTIKCNEKMQTQREFYKKCITIGVEILNLCTMIQLLLNRNQGLLTDYFAPKCIFDILLNKIFSSTI